MRSIARSHSSRLWAGELRISVRTVYRDIDALSLAGVPIYTERGPGGGCELMEGYRTNLTGLTADEVKALSMLNVPAPLADLGVSGELEAALRKLSAAIPAAHRPEEERSRQRIYLDSRGWFQSEEAAPFLHVVQGAVWRQHRLKIKSRLEFGTEAEWTVSPYGLVAKATTWYLVCEKDGGMRVVRVGSLIAAEELVETFPRTADFDLPGFWKTWSADFEKNQPCYPVTLRVEAEMIPLLHWTFGEQVAEIIRQAGHPDEKGRLTLTLIFERLEAARERILGLGRAVEVLEPAALRRSIADFAEQITALYQD